MILYFSCVSLKNTLWYLKCNTFSRPAVSKGALKKKREKSSFLWDGNFPAKFWIKTASVPGDNDLLNIIKWNEMQANLYTFAAQNRQNLWFHMLEEIFGSRHAQAPQQSCIMNHCLIQTVCRCVILCASICAGFIYTFSLSSLYQVYVCLCPFSPICLTQNQPHCAPWPSADPQSAVIFLAVHCIKFPPSNWQILSVSHIYSESTQTPNSSMLLSCQTQMKVLTVKPPANASGRIFNSISTLVLWK